MKRNIIRDKYYNTLFMIMLAIINDRMQTRIIMASETHESITGAELFLTPEAEMEGQSPSLATIIAVVGLTQKVNNGDVRQVIDVAKGINLQTIDELDQLVKISSRVRVVEPGDVSTNGDHNTSVSSQNGHSEADVLPLIKATSDQRSESNGPISNIKEAKDSDGSRHSDYFELPTYKEESIMKTIFDTVVDFIDDEQQKLDEGVAYTVVPGEDDRGSAMSALMDLVKEELSKSGIEFDASKKKLFHTVVNDLIKCGYLEATPRETGRGYERFKVGQPAVENLKKN